MPEAKRYFINDSIYHLFNRGVEKRDIFLSKSDYHHFLSTLVFYQQAKQARRFSDSSFVISDRSDELRFSIIAYCLMPNHFHLLIKQLTDGGISRGISQISNSYTRYFNTKYKRVGPLFQGRFKFTNVLDNEQFIHLSRYIFLNPFASNLVENIDNYRWSGYKEYIGQTATPICDKAELLDHFADIEQLQSFVLDYGDYARNLNQLKHLVLD